MWHNSKSYFCENFDFYEGLNIEIRDKILNKYLKNCNYDFFSII